MHHDSGNTVFRGAADWLCLAATPAFAIMALLTGLFGSSTPDIFCSAAHDASPLSGMVAMYLLMSVFHLAPWLKLITHKNDFVYRPANKLDRSVTDAPSVIRHRGLRREI
ncbi:MAG TPA: hypothetical protein VGH13_22240 [Xanthobacteraceae bacterium]